MGCSHPIAKVPDVQPRLLGRQCSRGHGQLNVPTQKDASPGSTTAGTPSPVSSMECRNGLGALIGPVNHIALVVRDIGDSIQFYTQVLGFRQMGRPNFDRHGAWLSMGNLELHLIKGVPDVCRGKHPDDLIVSHLALEIRDATAVLARLEELREKFEDLTWRRNVSVPTRQTSFENRFEPDHSSAQGQLHQFFLEDPDGYWIELCDCEHDSDSTMASAHFSRLSLVTRMIVKTLQWKKRAQKGLLEVSVQQELAALVQIDPSAVSSQKLEYLMLRRNTYGDVCQNFTREELLSALSKAGDHVPGAILLLKTWRKSTDRAYKPPSFLDATGKVHPAQNLAFISEPMRTHVV